MRANGESWRFYFAVVALLGFAVYIVERLTISHLKPEVAAPNYFFSRELTARRGSICSSLGPDHPYVSSIPYWVYRLDPVALAQGIPPRKRGDKGRTPAEIEQTIAEALKMDLADVKAKTANRANRYQALARSCESAAYEVMSDRSQVRGIRIEDTYVRTYPYGRSLCHVLGTLQGDGLPRAGIEHGYNRQLTGSPGVLHGMRDAHNNEIYDKRMVTQEPVPGESICLTIDPALQYEAERSLADGIKEFGAAEGWCIVMDAKTAAILAMASLPDYDPSDYKSATPDSILNRAIGRVYEPGSVMKVITAATALECGFATPRTVYRTNRDDPRYYKLPSDGSHKWEPTMTVQEAIVHSSNIVIGKLGYDLGPERLWTGLRRFGFGQKTGLDMPGEEKGLLPNWKVWDKAKRSRAAIGQGIGVTALQLIGAYQTIANDGVRLKPYIVDRIVSAKGEETYHHAADPGVRVISTKNARLTRAMMLDVASVKGTARKAAITGYTVAGKTGTAQKPVNGHYSSDLYWATFCGMVPAGEPEVVVLVTLDFHERTKFHQGGNSAGPIFRKLTKAILRYRMIPADRPEQLNEIGGDDEFDLISDARFDDSSAQPAPTPPAH